MPPACVKTEPSVDFRGRGLPCLILEGEGEDCKRHLGGLPEDPRACCRIALLDILKPVHKKSQAGTRCTILSRRCNIIATFCMQRTLCTSTIRKCTNLNRQVLHYGRGDIQRSSTKFQFSMGTGSLDDRLCSRLDLCGLLLLPSCCLLLSEAGEPVSASASPTSAGCFSDSANALSAECRLMVSEGVSFCEPGSVEGDWMPNGSKPLPPANAPLSCGD